MRLTVNTDEKYTMFAQVVGIERGGRMICGVENRFIRDELEVNFYSRINTAESILNTLQLR